MPLSLKVFFAINGVLITDRFGLIYKSGKIKIFFLNANMIKIISGVK